MLHRNSQKRYHGKWIYFITCVTKDRYPYFQKPFLCDLWIQDLRICKWLKQFDVYAFCLLYDHFHILLQPNEKISNISEIMRSFKTNYSRNINKLFYCPNTEWILYSKAGSRDPAFNNPRDPAFTMRRKFQRQLSYHDHYIRHKKDFVNHYFYTKDNYIKHSLPNDWKYHSWNVQYDLLIDNVYL